jgi:hypothetical protein
MKTNTPGGAKGNWPASDETARSKHPNAGQEHLGATNHIR